MKIRPPFVEGQDYLQRPGDDFMNYAYHYLSRSIYTGQLEGTHTLGDGSYKLNWVLGMNYINRNEPDYRRFRTYRPTSSQGTDDPYTMQLPPSANLFEAGRFWSTLQDKGFSNGLNFEKKFGDITSKRAPTFKAGYFVEKKSRDFECAVHELSVPRVLRPGNRRSTDPSSRCNDIQS
ncbi:MAG: hypothetical protein WDO15_09520 [Bacteroidota bacterium]